MGTLTLAELKVEVKAGLMNRSDLDSRLGRFLNLAQQRLARAHDFDEMEVISRTTLQNTGSDTDRFLQMPQLRECFSIVIIDGSQSRKLVGRTAQYMDRMMPKPEYWSRNYPIDYCVWGNYVEWFPLPHKALETRMRWTAWPLDLTLDNDKSQFNQKDELLIEYAVAYAYRSLGKEEDAAKHESFAKQLLKDAAEADRQHPDRIITPGLSDIQAQGRSSPADPWNDPFVKETNIRGI